MGPVNSFSRPSSSTSNLLRRRSGEVRVARLTAAAARIAVLRSYKGPSLSTLSAKFHAAQILTTKMTTKGAVRLCKLYDLLSILTEKDHPDDGEEGHDGGEFSGCR